MWIPKPKRTLLSAALLSTMLLAGCVGENEQTDPANKAPEAMMDVDRDSAWRADEFTFDAQDSRDPDGEVAKWHFDFGDGTTMEVQDVDNARVKHAYADGGEYTVTLTVTDDGAEQAGARTDTTEVRVAVNERHTITEGALHASPLPNETSSATYAFEGHAGLDAAVLDAQVTSLLVAGSSELHVELRGPDGVAYEETVTVAAGETESLQFEAPLEDAGAYELFFEAQSGSVSVDGELHVMYDAGF